MNRSDAGDDDEVGVQIGVNDEDLKIAPNTSSMETPVRTNTLRKISSASGSRIRGSSSNRSPSDRIKNRINNSPSLSLFQDNIQDAREHLTKDKIYRKEYLELVKKLEIP